MSVWLSSLLLDRIFGRRAAIIGSFLLATDATFLIATTYDFGPIVFLHCFLLAGIPYLESLKTGRIVTVDWGYATTLCLFSDGEMPLDDISYTLLNPSEPEAAWIGTLMRDPENVFVNHTEGGEQFAGVRARLASIAAQAGVRGKVVRIIRDRNDRPRFEIVRYLPSQ
ncbi:MAG TPA: hypothetical protein VNY05_26625 [Candidatus Acidoferrales bacterium]|jgi:hypothetical protein|nr:hypothetical protein [Candidatus Acidoferrales bacterium]